MNPHHTVFSGGLFVTFEGLDGCGKTTQMGLLAQRLRQQCPEKTILETLNPGGTPLGLELRQLLLSHRQGMTPPSPRAELLLYLADRAQHMDEVVLPALNQGTIVLCDRFADSTLAYQGYGRGLSLVMLQQINAWASDARVPDVTFLYDAPVEVLRLRLQGPKDRLESESLAFFERVRQGYLDLARQYPRRIHVLDATQSIDALAAQTADLMGDLLKTN